MNDFYPGTQEEMRYQAEEDARILAKAESISSDPQRLNNARNEAKRILDRELEWERERNRDKRDYLRGLATLASDSTSNPAIRNVKRRKNGTVTGRNAYPPAVPPEFRV